MKGKFKPQITQMNAEALIIKKIDSISALAMVAYRDCSALKMNPWNDGYDRGALCGYQLSISILASDIPGFASTVFERPAVSRLATSAREADKNVCDTADRTVCATREAA